MMDPGYIVIDPESQPVPLDRGWGLVCSFLVMLVATWGAFRLGASPTTTRATRPASTLIVP